VEEGDTTLFGELKHRGDMKQPVRPLGAPTPTHFRLEEFFSECSPKCSLTREEETLQKAWSCECSGLIMDAGCSQQDTTAHVQI